MARDSSMSFVQAPIRSPRETQPNLTRRSGPKHALNDPGKAVVGMKAFFNLMEHWKVDNGSAIILLGSPATRTFYNWKKGMIRKVPMDTMWRISNLLGIHHALRSLFRTPDNYYGWLLRENADFNGQPPLERMLAGHVTDLAFVRDYLESMRMGWS